MPIKREFQHRLARGAGIEPIVAALRKLATHRGLTSFSVRSDGMLVYELVLMKDEDIPQPIISDELLTHPWDLLRAQVELEEFKTTRTGYMMFMELLLAVSARMLAPVGWLVHPGTVLWAVVQSDMPWFSHKDFLGIPVFTDSLLEQSDAVLLCTEAYGATIGESIHAFRVILEQPHAIAASTSNP